ncbi:GNAT family N-acetyltransferase [Paractinoplanes atraurantiacus]|uniref:Protein N-acetyltransferase, RimJ/RimL family n=1 Tax=Paractinoplanes atraurantiacus TaxID=1036182 RepID=A0A285J5M6_9ACTN|nr:GNAT family protein [Actinoplanes atraurantiacus]SNY54401.1 Protein N-acetyltransferase, RimJ/RimL family [Actinoplanes atraurantiacus]
MVSLRPLTASDYPAVHSWAQLPEVCRFQTWGPNTLAESQSFTTIAARAWAQTPQTRFPYAVKAAGHTVGTAELKLRDPHQAEISYLIHPAHQGQGLATAAATRLLNLAFHTFGRHRVYATCDPRNAASARVLTKLGMTHEGRLRETLLLRDGWRDSDLYAILTHEWPART